MKRTFPTGPLLLAFAVVLVDQITKALVVSRIPLHTIGAQYFGDFLRIIHVGNHAVAFSLGAGLPEGIRTLLFILLPVILLIGLTIYLVCSRDLTSLQRWSVGAILGGGTGNLIDRIFREGGVVDFIDVKFYGLFGLERWPTFNAADSSIVIGGILLIISILTYKEPQHE